MSKVPEDSTCTVCILEVLSGLAGSDIASGVCDLSLTHSEGKVDEKGVATTRPSGAFQPTIWHFSNNMSQNVPQMVNPHLPSDTYAVSCLPCRFFPISNHCHESGPRRRKRDVLCVLVTFKFKDWSPVQLQWKTNAVLEFATNPVWVGLATDDQPNRRCFGQSADFMWSKANSVKVTSNKFHPPQWNLYAFNATLQNVM